MEIKNRKLSIDEFKSMEKDVMCAWPTGAEVNFEETVEYHKRLPKSKIFCEALKDAKLNKKTLIQPRAGVALVDSQIELLKYLQDEGKADLLPTTIDSYTRHNRYKDAQKGIEETIRSGHSMLNGFPAVNHGVHMCRQVNEAVSLPVQVRHGTPDARLLAEITIAGGFTSFEGGGISYNIPYAKHNSLEKTISDWQYVDRLVGLYEEAGVSINREPFGPLTGTLVPPCISHSVAIIEALLAAEQGVKDITVGYGQCGNIIQDIAAVRSLEILAEEYMNTFNYKDIKITTVFHQWMGGFPNDEAQSMGVISWGAATAALSGATKVIVKSPQESFGIPTMKANSEGLRATKQVVSMLRVQGFPLMAELEDEMKMIMAETRSIINSINRIGNDNIGVGIVRAFEAGLIDIPFAPSKHNAGQLMPIRDNNGAVRIYEFGNLPFRKEIKDFHREKIRQRATYEKRNASFQMVIDDIEAVSRGELIGRPKTN